MAKKRPAADSQMDFFGAPATPPEEPKEKLGLAEVSDSLKTVAAQLPSQLRMGTSSWSFPGWQGFVWDRKASADLLAKEGLRYYAQHPVFRSVGIDRTYYAPINAEAFKQYADVVPDHFRFLVKAAEALTMPRYPHHPRYGAMKGQDNPRFLDPGFAIDAVVAPFIEGLGEKGGPLLFQFSPMKVEKLGGVEAFAEKLGKFLEALPKGPLYAVELRNSELYVPVIRDVLKATGTIPALTGWADLPNVAAQAEALDALNARALVIRWMLPPGHNYEGAYDRFEPFSALALPDPSTRELIVKLAKAAIEKEGAAYVIVNNKAEGSAPLSIFELARSYANG